MLSIFDAVALDVIILYFPSYAGIRSDVHVRITELPVSSELRDLRRSNLNKLVRVKGVVTRRTGVFPQLKYVKFDCSKCGGILGPFYQDASREIRVSFCPNCESKGPFSVNSDQVSFVRFLDATDILKRCRGDCIQELSENDFARVPGFRARW